MDPLAALPQPVSDALARGWTVLTANQRAARTLRRAFDLRQRELDRSNWQPPQILAWDTWLAALWHHLLLDGRASELLLSSAQEHTVWRAIIDADAGSPNLRDSLAELAADAWIRLHAYRARRRLQASANSEDTRAFARWAKDFERTCLRSRLLTQAQLPETLTAAVETGQLALPPGLLLVGFDSFNPAQHALLDALRTADVPIDEHIPAHASDPSDANFSRLLIDAPDPHSELLTCARWIRIHLSEVPAARIAVIVPSIEEDRAGIDRIFRRILAPELNDIAASATSGPFEFSLGVPIAQVPLTAAALAILRWAAGPLPLDRVSALLLSPHFAADGESTGGSTSELSTRAEFDAFTLRKRPLLEPEITIDGLATFVSHSRHAASLPTLQKHLQSLRTQLRREPLTSERSHAGWAAAFQGLLDAAGWAPYAHLDSVEFQARRKWESVLDELATLDFDASSSAARISLGDALAALTRIAAQTLFAPESRHAPVQIMGPLESAGSTFDAIWFLRAGSQTWPPASSPSPLLAWALQREFTMPGADPAVDSERTRRITGRIVAAAPTVAFSYAQHTSDGRQRPSPLLSVLDLTARSAATIVTADDEPAPIALDSLLDDAPIPAPPLGSLHGGASILEAQAACAFRAFAERRLFSSALEPASLGLDARQRGSLIHAVLHSFWSEARSHSALRRMTTDERTALLQRCIDTALARDHSRPAQGWPRAYIETERARLLRLLGLWLDYEAGRPPFTIKSLEQELKDVLIGPLQLDVRVDRIDIPDDPPPPPAIDPDLAASPPALQPDPPAEIILDYKTGRALPSAWDGDRPDAPQLPLYAVVSPAPRLAAVAFASVRPGNLMGLTGIQSQAGILPGAKQTRDLEAQRVEWRIVLTKLAEQFHAGRALADPKDYPTTCRYCQQRLLCRLDVAALDSADLEEYGADSNASTETADREG